MMPFKVQFLDQKFCPSSCDGHVDNQCENDGVVWDCRRRHCGAVTAVFMLRLGILTELKTEAIPFST